MAQGGRSQARTDAHLRHPPARHRPRDGQGGLGGRRRADPPCRRRHHRRGAGDLRAHGFGRPEPHDGASRRPARQARGQPQPLGRRRPGARRRGHGAGRRSGDGRRADEGIHGPRHRHLHPVRLPAPRRGLSLRRAGVPAAAAGASRRTAPLTVNTGPFGETIANDIRPAARAASCMACSSRPDRGASLLPAASRPGRCRSRSSSSGRSRR